MIKILQTRVPFWLGVLLIVSSAFFSFSWVLAYDRQQTDKMAILQPTELNLDALKKSPASQ